MTVKDWEKDEMICDFLVTSERKKLWSIQLELMEELLRVCKKNDIKIFAVCGTLLGAVRHKGFIPWDDDSDFGMDRENYEKLLSCADDFKSPFFLQHVYTDKYVYSDVMRLRNSNTTAIEKKDEHSLCNNGIYIDIFPFDRIPNDTKKMSKLIIENRWLKRFVYWPRKTDLVSYGDRIKKNVFSLVSLIVGYDRLYSIYQKNCAKYNSNKNMDRVGIVSGSPEHNEFYYYAIDIEDVCELQFEYLNIPVPKGYKRCLEVNYGDYMKFPPVENRGQWHEGMLTIDVNTPYVEYQKNKGWI